MEGANFSNALNQCAMECSLRRLNGVCRYQFDSMSCSHCKYYIKNYTDAEPRHVQLFMLQAETQAGILKGNYNNQKLVWWFLLGVAVFFVLAIVIGQKVEESWFRDHRPPNNIPRVEIKGNHDQHNNIIAAMDKVSSDLYNKVDVNGDRKTNCVDAAVLFYKYYPDKEQVCIEVNHNPDTGMNHLFNCVLINGYWRAVEPQSIHSRQTSYYMMDVWGSSYDNQYNKDVTSKYIQYIK